MNESYWLQKAAFTGGARAKFYWARHYWYMMGVDTDETIHW
jgi:hypothetical protein